MLDPNCSHNSQCAAGPFGPGAQEVQDVSDVSARPNLDEWRRRRDLSHDVTNFWDTEPPVYCCSHQSGFRYTLILFDKPHAPVMEYLAKRFHWDEGKRAEIDNLHPWRRIICRECRYDYEVYAFLKNNPEYGESLDTNEEGDDILHGEKHLHRQSGHIFSPSLYAGGVFDGTRSKYHYLIFDKALASLTSQRWAEKVRYFIKHDSYDGYSPRFVFGGNLGGLFGEASRTTFPETTRNPVGLNPERFVSECKTCGEYMLDQELGVEYCEICSAS